MSDAPDNVVFLNVKTALDVPVERILDGARDANLAQVLVQIANMQAVLDRLIADQERERVDLFKHIGG